MPRIEGSKQGRIDGDHQRIKDYDIKEGEQKKKFTYFFTKQEVEEQKMINKRGVSALPINYSR